MRSETHPLDSLGNENPHRSAVTTSATAPRRVRKSALHYILGERGMTVETLGMGLYEEAVVQLGQPIEPEGRNQRHHSSMRRFFVWIVAKLNGVNVPYDDVASYIRHLHYCRRTYGSNVNKSNNASFSSYLNNSALSILPGQQGTTLAFEVALTVDNPSTGAISNFSHHHTDPFYTFASFLFEPRMTGGTLQDGLFTYATVWKLADESHFFIRGDGEDDTIRLPFKFASRNEQDTAQDQDSPDQDDQRCGNRVFQLPEELLQHLQDGIHRNGEFRFTHGVRLWSNSIHLNSLLSTVYHDAGARKISRVEVTYLFTVAARRCEDLDAAFGVLDNVPQSSNQLSPFRKDMELGSVPEVYDDEGSGYLWEAAVLRPQPDLTTTHESVPSANLISIGQGDRVYPVPAGTSYNPDSFSSSAWQSDSPLQCRNPSIALAWDTAFISSVSAEDGGLVGFLL
ncbi:hypothetical protein NMY22_g9622 [Coprinellus aureogranulatus]|nr:hypothetical protein NMY22_g9622 [Coprinellus aureogranulatus]